jgi:hypothetical protein
LEFETASLSNWPLLLAVLAAAFAGKLLGGFWGGRLAGMDHASSWAIGIGVNGRGIMELVIANIALANGFVSKELFSILVTMGGVTTFMTPLLMRRVLQATNQSKGGVEVSALPETRPNPLNDPPVANPDYFITVEGRPLAVSGRQLTINDYDPEGDQLTVTGVIAEEQTYGMVAKDQILYRPQRGFTGTARFRYVVSDGQGGTAVGSVTVTVVLKTRSLKARVGDIARQLRWQKRSKGWPGNRRH